MDEKYTINDFWADASKNGTTLDEIVKPMLEKQVQELLDKNQELQSENERLKKRWDNICKWVLSYPKNNGSANITFEEIYSELEQLEKDGE